MTKTRQAANKLAQAVTKNDEKAGTLAAIELLVIFIDGQERIADALESLAVNYGG